MTQLLLRRGCRVIHCLLQTLVVLSHVSCAVQLCGCFDIFNKVCVQYCCLVLAECKDASYKVHFNKCIVVALGLIGNEATATCAQSNEWVGK